MTVPQRNKPASVVLDLLRSSRGGRRSAAGLVAAGELFGHSANTMRVTLSRLVARGLIESPARGRYQLTGQTDGLNQFVERWRDGEARVRPWDEQSWLFAHLSDEPRRSRWALDALGFREVRPGLLARPDNLALDTAALQHLGHSIGLSADALFVTGTPHPASPDWRHHWTPQDLNASYADALARLQASSARLDSLAQSKAQLECFALGGEMIHRLAKDPLLPAQWVDVDTRKALLQATLAYDVQGQQIWAAGRSEALQQMPRPQLLKESLA